MSRPEPRLIRSPVRWRSVRPPGQAYKVAQRRNVGAVRSDARGVHGQAESLGDLQGYPGIVEFREAEPDHRQDMVCARRGHGPRRRTPLPTALHYIKELLPIVLVPHRSRLPRRIRFRKLSSYLQEQTQSQICKEICPSLPWGSHLAGSKLRNSLPRLSMELALRKQMVVFAPDLI